jgi:hypothetical protein
MIIIESIPYGMCRLNDAMNAVLKYRVWVTVGTPYIGTKMKSYWVRSTDRGIGVCEVQTWMDKVEDMILCLLVSTHRFSLGK